MSNHHDSIRSYRITWNDGTNFHHTYTDARATAEELAHGIRSTSPQARASLIVYSWQSVAGREAYSETSI